MTPIKIVNREELIKILATMGDDHAKGFELLETFIDNTAIKFALKQVHELHNKIKQNNG